MTDKKLYFKPLIMLEYIMIFFIILSCNSVYATALRDYHINDFIPAIALIIFVLNISHNTISRTSFTRYVRVFVPYFILMLIYLILRVPSSRMMGFTTRFLFFIPVMTLCFSIQHERGNSKRMIKAYIYVMAIESAISLFFWVFGSRLHYLSPNMVVPSSWGTSGYTYPGYYGLYFERQYMHLFGLTGFRNDGIFTEGPMHSLCVFIALAMNWFLLYEEKRNMNRKSQRIFEILNILFFITLASIESVSGILLMILAVVIRVYVGRPKDKRNYILRTFFVLIVVIGGGLFSYFLIAEKQGSSSWMVRLDDIQAGIKAWLKSPIIGNGYGSYEVENYMSSFRLRNTGYSNALFSVLSQGGIVLFSTYFRSFFLALLSVIKRKDWNSMFFIILIIIEFIITLFQTTFLLMFLLAYFYSIYVSNYTKKVSNSKY